MRYLSIGDCPSEPVESGYSTVPVWVTSSKKLGCEAGILIAFDGQRGDETTEVATKWC